MIDELVGYLCPSRPSVSDEESRCTRDSRVQSPSFGSLQVSFDEGYAVLIVVEFVVKITASGGHLAVRTKECLGAVYVVYLYVVVERVVVVWKRAGIVYVQHDLALVDFKNLISVSSLLVFVFLYEIVAVVVSV